VSIVGITVCGCEGLYTVSCYVGTCGTCGTCLRIAIAAAASLCSGAVAAFLCAAYMAARMDSFSSAVLRPDFFHGCVDLCVVWMRSCAAVIVMIFEGKFFLIVCASCFDHCFACLTHFVRACVFVLCAAIVEGGRCADVLLKCAFMAIVSWLEASALNAATSSFVGEMPRVSHSAAREGVVIVVGRAVCLFCICICRVPGGITRYLRFCLTGLGPRLQSVRFCSRLCAMVSMWCVGVICPPTGVVVPAGYELTDAERRVLAGRVRGVPLNVDHVGVRGAVLGLVARGRPVDGSSVRAVLPHVGVVRDGWHCPSDGSVWVLFEIFSGYELVRYLFCRGQLSCLSLTHLSGPECMPVEVTLCSAPARPFSFVRYACGTLVGACEYKARVQSGEIKADTMDVTTKPEVPAPEAVSRIAAILGQLTAADRGLIEARFTEMMSSVDDAESGKKDALDRLDMMSKIKATDVNLFTTHFDELLAQLPPETLAKYSLNSDMKKVIAAGANSEVLHHVGQLIRCASATLVSKTPATVERGEAGSSKRMRVSEPEADVPVAGSALSRALANTFGA
jgi:hypothetical protein